MNTLQARFTLLALFIILFLDGFGQSVIFPILTKTLENPNSHELVNNISHQLRDAYYAISVGVFFLCWAFGAAFLGDLSDSIGRKKSLVICILGMAIGNIVVGSAFYFHHVWLLILGRVIVGLTAGSQAIAQASIADVSTPENQAKNTGYVLLAVTLGLLLGPVFGEFFSNGSIASWFTDQTPLYLIAGICVIVILLLATCFNDTRKPSHKPVSFFRIFHIFHEAFTHKNIRRLFISFFLMFACWSIYYFYMNIFLVHKFGARSGDITIYMTCIGLGLSLGMAVFPGIIEKRFSTHKAAASLWFIVFLATLATIFSQSLNLDFIIAVIVGASVGSGFVFILKAFSEQASADQQGWVMGILNACWVSSMGVMVLITGWVSNFNINAPFYLGGVLFIIGFILFLTRKSRSV